MTASFKPPIGTLGSGRYAPYAQRPDGRFVHHVGGHKPSPSSSPHQKHQIKLILAGVQIIQSGRTISDSITNRRH